LVHRRFPLAIFLAMAHSCARSLLVLPAVLIFAHDTGAQGRRISPPPRRVESETVSEALLAPDGGATVYLQVTRYGTEEERSALFVATDAGARELVSSAGTLGRFAISPDGRYVAYQEMVSGFASLFAVPLDGGAAPRRLGPPREGTSVASDFVLAAGERVVFRCTPGPAALSELDSIALTGHGPAQRLDTPRADGRSLTSFQVSPDGGWVAYLADADALGRFELYLAPITGGVPARKLNGAFLVNGDVLAFRFAPDSERVVYLANQERGSSNELYSAPVPFAAPAVRLHLHGAAGSRVQDDFQISADGASVVYRHNLVDNRSIELFRVPIKGGLAPARLNPPLPPLFDVRGFALARDGSVVYRADQEFDGRVELYHVRDGAAPVKLNAPLAAGEGVGYFQLAPDGRRVLSVVEPGAQVFLASLDGSVGPVAIPAPSGSSAAPFALAASGERLVFRRDGGLLGLALDGASTPFELLYPQPDFQTEASWLELAGERALAKVFTGQVRELFAVPLAGGIAQRVSGRMPMNYPLDDAFSPRLTPDGSRVVFGFGTFGDFASHDDQRVLSVELTDGPTGSAPVQLFAAGSLAVQTRFWIAPRGARVVSLAEIGKLSSAPIDGSAPPVFLAEGGLTAFTPDGARALYLDAAQRLHSVALDGTTPPALLGGFPALGSVTFHAARLSADGARVAYHFRVAGESAARLLAAPTDGSAAPVELAPSLAVERLIDVAAGDRVVFQTAAGQSDELWSVPIDGSAAPVRLAGAHIHETASDTSLCVSGEHLFFLADEGELFTVPVDGSAAPLALAPGYLVDELVVGGERAFFVGVAAGGTLAELFSVPRDGGVAPVRLSRASPDGATFLALRVAAGGARVVWSRVFGDLSALESAPSDGSAEPVLLSPSLPTAVHEIPGDFQLSADGRTVAFSIATYDPVTHRRRATLFTAPCDGSRPRMRVSAEDTAIPEFQLDPGGRFVVYVSDEDEEGLYELFLARTQPFASASSAPGRLVTR
jgi:Tol biopolymer transport system component